MIGGDMLFCTLDTGNKEMPVVVHVIDEAQNSSSTIRMNVSSAALLAKQLQLVLKEVEE
jgi:hypothetical protein